uniref:Cytochrome b6f complex subunit 6 n=1 Tax=Porphyridium purpureum TaxID=35688 RepID=W0RZD3_PORPP|nr:cytochrome b6f complex subunit 6 [Porphyridium purpureum]ATJ02971.1 cytochrome b6f complex subunit 6 [Porphyridium purpureum]BAO23755.1 cytochrome b6f complex subunit 6 [Porphyridium purpureum]
MSILFSYILCLVISMVIPATFFFGLKTIKLI